MEDASALSLKIAKRAVWDLALSPQDFIKILHGELTVDWPTQAFCVARLLECCNWYDATKILPPRDICTLWPEAKRFVRSPSIRLGMEYAYGLLQ